MKITIPTPLPTNSSEIEQWHFTLSEVCQLAYFDNKTRIQRFLDKARTLRKLSNKHWAITRDMQGLNSTLVQGLIAIMSLNKELWDRVLADRDARRLLHPDDCVMTARKLIAHLYSYYRGMPEIDRFVGTNRLMSVQWDDYKDAKLVEFWKKWCEYERLAGDSVDEKVKFISLLAQMQKSKIMNDEVMRFERKSTKR